MLHADETPLTNKTLLPGAVVSVESIWKMNTAPAGFRQRGTPPIAVSLPQSSGRSDVSYGRKTQGFR
jgi:hypothetical protein